MKKYFKFDIVVKTNYTLKSTKVIKCQLNKEQINSYFIINNFRNKESSFIFCILLQCSYRLYVKICEYI